MGSSGLIHAFILDSKGGAKSITLEEIKQWEPDDDVLWLHVDHTVGQARELIATDKHLDDLSKTFLLSEESRPRTSTIEDALFLALRGINLNQGSDPEDMVSLRLWADKNRIITTVRRNLLSIQEMSALLEVGKGPRDPSEFIVRLIELLIDKMSNTIDNLEDRLAELEEKILGVNAAELRILLSSIRRESIFLRRHLAPQRESMLHLFKESIPWFHEIDRLRLRESTDQLIRYIEDLDSVRDRAAILHEELVSHISEQINSRMYTLSLVAAIFLPLSFLTGLFGINVGGIPGSASKIAFPLFVLILVGISIALYILFKKKKWM